MSNIVRAWKDAAYRESLSAQEQAMLPENPAGGLELTDAELEAVYGAGGEEEEGAHSRDFCSNAQVCKISAFTSGGSDDCISVGIGADCNSIA